MRTEPHGHADRSSGGGGAAGDSSGATAATSPADAGGSFWRGDAFFAKDKVSGEEVAVFPVVVRKADVGWDEKHPLWPMIVENIFAGNDVRASKATHFHALFAASLDGYFKMDESTEIVRQRLDNQIDDGCLTDAEREFVVEGGPCTACSSLW